MQPRVDQLAQPTRAVPRRSPLADHSIELIAGIGDHFLSVLGGLAVPITDVAALAALNPEDEIEGMSHERRLELRTKAEMILSITVERTLFAALAGESLETLLALPPAVLARRANQPAAQAKQLQRDLRALRLLVKNDAFRSLSLSDLMWTA